MKKISALILMLILGSYSAFAAEEAIVADFNDQAATNNLGNIIEVWMKDKGADPTQSCSMTFVQDDALGVEGGYSVKIDYDVDSPNGAYNGFRTSLKGLNLAGYTHLNFYVKGDPGMGFGKKFKIELIGDSKVPSPYIVDGVTEEWQKISVPFTEFFAIRNWSELGNFVIVFADLLSDPKTGSILIDQIYFSKE